jgi:hypothetical protein
MAKITTMKQLRERVIQAFEDLEEGKIDISHALTLGKLNETIVSGLKSEMQYAVLTNSIPVIPFFDGATMITLEQKDIKKLT